MMKSIKTICLVGVTAFLTACGWHFDNGAAVPAELKTMALESSDPYSEMSMAMRKQLLSNNVNLVPAKQGVPVLRLNKQTSSDKVASVFKQGRENNNRRALYNRFSKNTNNATLSTITLSWTKHIRIAITYIW